MKTVSFLIELSLDDLAIHIAESLTREDVFELITLLEKEYDSALLVRLHSYFTQEMIKERPWIDDLWNETSTDYLFNKSL